MILTSLLALGIPAGDVRNVDISQTVSEGANGYHVGGKFSLAQRYDDLQQWFRFPSLDAKGVSSCVCKFMVGSREGAQLDSQYPSSVLIPMGNKAIGKERPISHLDALVAFIPGLLAFLVAVLTAVLPSSLRVLNVCLILIVIMPKSNCMLRGLAVACANAWLGLGRELSSIPNFHPLC